MKHHSALYMILCCAGMMLLAVIFAIWIPKNYEKVTLQQNNPTQKIVKAFSPQENEGGEVTVIVTPQILEVGKEPKFQIVFDTHSVNLDFDVGELVILIDDKGKKYTNPVWEGSPRGGHHRSGSVSFSETLKETSQVKLVLQNISGIKERAFQWDL